MNRRFIWAVGVVVSLWGNAVAGQLKVDASYRLYEGHPAVVFTVRNESNAPILMSRADLPWGQNVSLTLVGYDVKARRPLSPVHPVEDAFLSPEVRIDPKKSISGPVVLESHIDGVNERLGAGDVLVFWHFGARTAKEAPLGEYGGWLRIPKQSIPSR